jgi:hypothetical protein
MKKKLNVDMIQSELRGGSAFFPGYKGSSSPEVPDKVEENTAADNPVPPGVPPPVPHGVPHTEPLVPKTKRPIRQRQPFDIFEDQYQALKKIADAERGFVNGRGMSHMVREAIENYLRDHGTSRD